MKLPDRVKTDLDVAGSIAGVSRKTEACFCNATDPETGRAVSIDAHEE